MHKTQQQYLTSLSLTRVSLFFGRASHIINSSKTRATRKSFCGLFAAAFLILSLGTAHGTGTPGTLKWSYPTGNYIHSSPAIGADGTIYVGSGDNNLYAINCNGTLKWSFPAGNAIFSSPAIGRDGTVYVGSDDSNLYAVHPDGTLKWSYTVGNYIHSSPAIGADGTIYVGSDDHNLYAIRPNGTLKWSYTVGNYIHSSPAIGADGTIYVGSGDNNLYAVNPNGTLKWSFPTAHWIYSSPAIGVDGTIYVGSGDHNLYAINPDGTLKWSYPTGFWIYSSPAIGTDGTIYVGSDDHNLYAINPDGTLKWSFPIGPSLEYSSPAIGADGTIYVGSDDYNLYAINPDGTLKWYYTAGNYIYSSPVIGADGTIYVGSWDFNLYAIHSSSPGLASSPWPMFHHDLEHTGLVFSILHVTTSGTGSGTVTSSPAGTDCGSTCSAGYKKGTKVTLTPVPESGSVFTGWTGDCTGTGACFVIMKGDKSVGAAFDTGSCTYTLSPGSKALTYRGGKITLRVTAKDYTYCAAPEIVNSTDFTYTATAFTKNKGSIKLFVPALDSSISRTGTMTIGGDTVTVTQKGKPCTLTLSSTSSLLFPKAGGPGFFDVSVTPVDCAWSAHSNVDWVHAPSESQEGNQEVDFMVDENTGTTARSGKIAVTLSLSKKTKSYAVKQGKE